MFKTIIVIIGVYNHIKTKLNSHHDKHGPSPASQGDEGGDKYAS